MGNLFIENRLESTNNFLSNIRKMKENTLNFENSSIREEYKNENIKYMENTKKNLTYFRNILQDKYRDRIMYYRRLVTITKEQALEFDMNPYLAAHRLMGNPDYWWLILFVNKKMNVESFTKLKDRIYIPDIDDIKECLVKELKKNEDIG